MEAQRGPVANPRVSGRSGVLHVGPLCLEPTVNFSFTFIFGCVGLCCGVQALQVWHVGLAAPRQVGS